MKVLVTGGAGFIGSHVCERLVARGDEVVIVDSFDSFYDPAIKRRNVSGVLSSERATLIEQDICDASSLAHALRETALDAIVHLAARAGVRPSLERPLDYVRSNVEGTMALLEFARTKGIRPFVFGSSSSVYGDATPAPFSESAAADSPISPYAATKRAAELMCRAHAHLFGLSVICVRLFTVYGPRQRPDLAIHKFARLMEKGEEIPFFGDGSTERDYTYVDDIVNGIESAIDWCLASPGGSFETVNLGESRTTSLAQLVELIARSLDVEPKLRRLPVQPGDVQRTFADVSRARDLLGYEPATSIEDGIRCFVDWFRSQPRD